MNEKEITKEEMIGLIRTRGQFQESYLRGLKDELIRILYMGFLSPLKRSVER